MFESENTLESSLVQAATDPSHRPQFYRDLLGSDIYIITAGNESLDLEDGVLKQGARIQVQSTHNKSMDWLCIFSSLSRLQQYLQTEASYLCLNAKGFFEFTRGANVILNPNLEYGKEFPAPEIESILDGSIFNVNQTYTVEEGSHIFLGQPSDYPNALVTALSQFFQKQASVRAAYLAQLFNSELDEPPHLVIGIDTKSDIETVVSKANLILEEVISEKEYIDFFQISYNDTDFSRYMLQETKPFYKKSFLRKLFG